MNKKLPSLIGKSVITIFATGAIVSLNSYLIKTFSINLMDTSYSPSALQIFFILGSIITSFLALDYLFKYLICLIFRRYKNLSISNKLPKIIYNYLISLKLISGIEHSFHNLFIINFGIYLIVLLLLVSVLILI